MRSRTATFSVRSLFLVAAALGLALSLLPQTVTAQEAAPKVQVPDTADAVLQVNGMACSACAQRMKSVLEDVEGVDRATVLLEKQNVVLTLSDQQTPSEQILREAVTSAGYEFRTAVFAKGQKSKGTGE
ncbi:heavy-metal-associated domain-containing protein [Salinibacter ruber]|uniref:heavy-metal-associated domain-containing protein n=1 Tax=Salinibacter ruber TaxID=146919 RepID=UPI00216A3D48|nr:heavy metal-associated domain-containing protein [Salinibacter ruber]MCS3699228.1 copper chaperone CopZ [Salinibacter ruber]MCS4096981.1 copper chaperone CopZ [Salinibacter ruber]